MNVTFPHTVDLSIASFLRVYLLDLNEWALAVQHVSAEVPAVVVTDVPHGLSVGDQVLLTGCRDMAGVNDVHTVLNVLDDVSFTVDNERASGRYAGGGLVMRIAHTTVDQMPWQAYVGDCWLSNVRYEQGVLDADNCRIIAEKEKYCDAVAIFGCNDLADTLQMLALMVDGLNLQFVTNGQPIHIMWANTPERILSDTVVGQPILFQQPNEERTFPGTVHLYAKELERKVVLVDGRVLQDVVEAKRFPDGRGFALSLLDAAGNSKRWIDGQYKLNTFRGEIEILEAL